MKSGWDRAEFFALAARLNAAGIGEARPPNEDETAGVYLSALYGWVFDACTRTPVLDDPPNRMIRRVRFDDHLIDHDAQALLRGENLDPTKRGVSFTYKRGSF